MVWNVTKVAPIQLTPEALYQREVLALPRLTHADEASLADRARAGDRQARQALIVSLLPVVRSYAYSLCKRRMLPMTLNVMDLIAAGNQALVEEIDKALERAANPSAYLTTAAYKAIRDYCHCYYSIISTPDTHDAKPMYVNDIDTEEDRAETTSANTKRDYQPLYDALATLTDESQQIISSLFGLGDIETKTLMELAGTASGTLEYDRISGRKLWICKRLRKLLEPQYPQYAGKKVQRYHFMSVRLPEQKRARLDQAYQALIQRGEKITVHRLRQEAHVHPQYASVYMYQRREREEKAS